MGPRVYLAEDRATFAIRVNQNAKFTKILQIILILSIKIALIRDKRFIHQHPYE